MDTVTIRNEIEQAVNHEANTHELASLLHRRFHRLYPKRLVSPTSNPDQQLFIFVCNFINRTPNLLDTLLDATRGSSREDLCDAVTVICLDFFMAPPPLLSGRRGLNGAMGKAYLCHRMIEELNDYCTLSSNAPLLPVDLSFSNLIVHQLIGKPFANLLDEMIQITLHRLSELAPANFCLVPPEETEARLRNLCQHRLLIDESVAPAFYTGDYGAYITVH